MKTNAPGKLFGGSPRRPLFALLVALICIAGFSTARAVTEERAGKPILIDPAPTASSPSSASKPAAAPRNSFDLDAGRVIIALVGVIALIFMLRWGGQKMLPAALGGGRGGSVKVLARCPLAPRQQIVLIQVGKRIIVAADCSSQLTSLSQITDPEEIAAILGSLQQEKTSPASAFSSWFAHARHAFGGDELEKSTALPADDNADMEPPARVPEGERLGHLTARVRDLARQFRGPGNAA